MRKLKILAAVITLCLVIALVVLPSCAPTPTAKPAAPTTWIMLSIDLPFSSVHNYFNYEMPKLIEERTNGRLVIDWRPGLYPMEEHLYAIKDNRAQIGMAFPDDYSDEIPEWGVASVPFFFRNADEFHKFMEAADPIFHEWVFEKHNFNVVSMFYWELAPQVLWSKKPVREVADFKGMKIQASALGMKAVDALGGAGMNVPYEEIYVGLERGLFDGTFMGDLTGISEGYENVVKYVSYWPFTMIFIEDVIVNKDALNALPKDLQKIVTDTLRELGPKMRELRKAEAPKAISTIEQKGVTVIIPSDSEIAKAEELTEPIRRAWAQKGEKTMELLNLAEKAFGREIVK